MYETSEKQLDTNHPDTLVHRPLDWLLSWLESQKNHDLVYTPQPYEMLANALDQAGMNFKAKQIRMAMMDYKKRSPQTPIMEKNLLLFSKYVASCSRSLTEDTQPSK